MIQSSFCITSVNSNTKNLPGIDTIIHSQDMNTNKGQEPVCIIKINF